MLSVDHNNKNEIVYTIAYGQIPSNFYTLRHRVYGNSGILEEQLVPITDRIIAFPAQGIRTEGVVLQGTLEVSQVVIYTVSKEPLTAQLAKDLRKKREVMPDASQVEEAIRDDGRPLQTGEDHP